MAYRTLRGGVAGLGSPYSDLSGGGGHHHHHGGGGGFRGGFRGGWSGPAWGEYPDASAGSQVMDCYRDAQGNLILGVPGVNNPSAKRGKCLVDAGGNILNLLPTPVNGLGHLGFSVRRAVSRAVAAPVAAVQQNMIQRPLAAVQRVPTIVQNAPAVARYQMVQKPLTGARMMPSIATGLYNQTGQGVQSLQRATGSAFAPVDRMIPGPLMSRLPGGVSTALAVATGNPLLASKVLRVPTRNAVSMQPVNPNGERATAGYLVNGVIQTAPYAAPTTYSGKAILVGGAWGRKVRMSWRNDNPPINAPMIGNGETVIDCIVDANGSYLGPVATPIIAQAMNGLGSWLSGVPVTPGSGINQQAAPAVIPTTVGGPPPEATVITQGLAIDATRGDLWVGPTKVPILPAVLSAIVVKVIMFGGSAAGGYVAGRFSKKA